MKSENEEEFGISQEDFIEQNTADDSTANEISELSKRGYQLLKENLTQDAVDAFSKILDIEANNNYALVGLGDCERKRGNFNQAIKHYTKSSCMRFI